MSWKEVSNLLSTSYIRQLYQRRKTRLEKKKQKNPLRRESHARNDGDHDDDDNDECGEEKQKDVNRK